MFFLNHHFIESHFDFLDSATYLMDGIISLNDHILYYEIIVLTIVIWIIILLFIYNAPFTIKDITHHTFLEIFWTLIPAIILIFIALPSFRLLYLMDDLVLPNLSIKVIGHQWYWSYGINNGIEFDSYIIQNVHDLNLGDFRSLEVDQFLLLPANTYLRFLITATDVLHSWSIPNLGIKIDAIPGRINQIGLEIYRPGLYFGSCYELCWHWTFLYAYSSQSYLIHFNYSLFLIILSIWSWEYSLFLFFLF